MKFKLTKEEHAALPDALKGEYDPVGNDYVLSLEGGPDAKASEKVDGERSRRRAAEKRANDAEARIAELEEQFADTKAAISKADKKTAEAVARAEKAEKKHVDYLTRMEVDTAAAKLAGELSATSAKLLLPHVRERLALDLTDPEAPKVVVLDAAGKPAPDKKLEDLAKEFRDNKDFAGIITQSRASGGNASRSTMTAPGNGIPAIGAQPQKPLSEMRPGDLLANIEARRAARQPTN